MNFDPEHLLKSPFLPALIGAYISLRFVPGMSFPERLFNLSAGCFLGGYFAPGIAEWFALDGSRVTAAVAVLVGLFGLHIADSMMQWIKAFTAAVVAWIAKAELSDFIPWGKKK
jgi:xanthosine utilization system XapX-like protein